MTCCKVTSAPGKLNLAGTGSGTNISYDPALLTAIVETVLLDNVELNQNWGKEVYRIRLRVSSAKLSGSIRLEIASA